MRSPGRPSRRPDETRSRSARVGRQWRGEAGAAVMVAAKATPNSIVVISRYITNIVILIYGSAKLLKFIVAAKELGG